MGDEISRLDVNIHPVGDIADRVAVAHNIVGMRPAVPDRCRKNFADLSLDTDCPNIRFRRFQQRVNAADVEACANNSSLSIQPTLECREDKPERRFAAAAQDEDGGLSGGCTSSEKCW